LIIVLVINKLGFFMLIYGSRGCRFESCRGH